MKKIFLVLFALLFLLLPFSALFAQTPDTAFVQAAADLYQPKANKAGVPISATAPLPIFRKADAKMKWIEENAAKNTVISISTTLFSTGNTPYAGKFVRENGGSIITCFVDKNGVKHEINKKYLPAVGNSGVQVDANNPNSDFLGSFVKEEGKSYITAYVDAYGTRHAVGVDATTLATKTSVDSAKANIRTEMSNNINYANSQIALKASKTELQDTAASLRLDIDGILKDTNRIDITKNIVFKDISSDNFGSIEMNISTEEQGINFFGKNPDNTDSYSIGLRMGGVYFARYGEGSFSLEKQTGTRGLLLKDYSYNENKEVRFAVRSIISIFSEIAENGSFSTDVDGNAYTMKNNTLKQLAFKDEAVTKATVVPTSSNDTTGNVGDVISDLNYIYTKTTSGWKRAALSTF